MGPSRGRGGRAARPSFDRGRGRGGSRGRGSTRSRGRGGRRSTFTTARVKQPVDEDSEETGVETTDSEEGSGEGEVSASDEDDVPVSSVPAFSALLQSLASEKPSNGPQRKKRKIEPEGRRTSRDHEGDGLPESAGGADNLDEVDEAEEAGSTGGLEVDAESEDEGIGQGLDPFEVHFANPNESILARRLEAIAKNEWRTEKIDQGKLGKAILSLPDRDVDSRSLAGKIADPGLLKLKSKLVETAKRVKPIFDPLEASLAPYIFNNQDLLFCGRTLENADGLRTMYCLHAINHVLKTRDRVIKNNARLAKDNAEDLELRDQGFTRPKVLVILPTRQSCVKVVDTIVALCEPDQQENKKRFTDSYVDTEEKFSADKPADFRDLFGGNDDDMFRLGLKFTRKTVKFFSRFYNSDIIFASPLGLRMAIGTDDAKTQDHDFLSSIELLILDQTDALLMQNWEHLLHILAHLNLQPREAHGCDFSRVRSWYLDGHARHLRQTLVFSAFNTPDLNSLFATHMQNAAGRIKHTPAYFGSLLRHPFPCKQTLSRFDSASPARDPDARFAYFCAAVLPSLLKAHSRSSPGGTLIYIPSTLDFIRLRNHLSSSSASAALSFGSISEYTPPPAVSRARSHFLTGRHAVLLLTERAHHFRRYRLRGVKRVIFYGLPDNPIFYEDVVGGFLGRSVQEGRVAEGSVRGMFSKWDGLRVERIVGSERVKGMVGGGVGDTFEFL